MFQQAREAFDFGLVQALPALANQNSIGDFFRWLGTLYHKGEYHKHKRHEEAINGIGIEYKFHVFKINFLQGANLTKFVALFTIIHL